MSPIDVDKLKQRMERRDGGKDRFKLQDGENRIRLLPPTVEFMGESVDYVDIEYLSHWLEGADGRKQNVICPKTFHENAKCPICEAAFKLWKSAPQDDGVKAESGKIRAKKKYLYNVLDLNDIAKGIQVFDVGPALRKTIVEYVTNKAYEDLLDIDKGMDVTIVQKNKEKTTTGFPEHSFLPDRVSTSVREKLPKNYKEVIGNLKNFIEKPKTYEELQAMLDGSSYMPEEEEEVVKPVRPTMHAAHPVATPKGVEEKKKEEAPPAATGETPECFGAEFGPKRPECVKCGSKEACREKFLEV